MRPVILYRKHDMEESELREAKQYFICFSERTAIQKDDLVVARYAALPFYDALEDDCRYVGARLINSYRQHRYIADLRNWAEDLKGLTPKTWYRLEDIDEEGPYFLKGATNSRKSDWSTHAFAKDLKAAQDVYWRLCCDGLIGGENQNIYIRKYVPLKTYLTGLNGLPVTKEFRFFTAYGEILSAGYYWANYQEDLPEIPEPEPRHFEFVRSVLDLIATKTTAVVVDVGETATGELTCIELNDLQQSGLSLNDPKVLYRRLREVVDSFR